MDRYKQMWLKMLILCHFRGPVWSLGVLFSVLAKEDDPKGDQHTSKSRRICRIIPWA